MQIPWIDRYKKFVDLNMFILTFNNEDVEISQVDRSEKFAHLHICAFAHYFPACPIAAINVSL
jgi:hypothetical protein